MVPQRRSGMKRHESFRVTTYFLRVNDEDRIRKSLTAATPPPPLPGGSFTNDVCIEGNSKAENMKRG